MSTQDYTTTFLVDQTPEEAFAAITNVRGWWSGEIDGSTDTLGDVFTYRYNDVHYSKQELVEVVPGRRVVWRIMDASLQFTEDKNEWNGTKVIFEVSRKGDRTAVRFTHEGLVPQFECFNKCSDAWDFYINTSLRNLIATGKGDPNPKEHSRPIPPLTGKNLVVVGGSRGVGRGIVEAGVRNGANVLAVARQNAPLRQLAQDVSGVDVLSIDAADEDATSQVFGALRADVLILSAGAVPPAAPIHQQNWKEFSVNWEADVKIAFHFTKAALSRPLPAGSSVILISSGAALAGSPNSGGYAAAKRAQLFIAHYGQKESDRLGLGVRFIALAPRLMPDTEFGRHAVVGYSRYLGVSEQDFIQSLPSPTTPSDVAAAVVDLAISPDRYKGRVFVVSAKGLEAVAA